MSLLTHIQQGKERTMRCMKGTVTTAAAALLASAIVSMSGCGPENLQAWEYSIKVVNGHTVLHTDGFDLWFEGVERNSQSRGQLLVVGLGESEKNTAGQGDGVFEHQFDGEALVMSLFGKTFKVTNQQETSFTLHVGGESFSVGPGDQKKVIIWGSGGSVRIGDPSQLKKIKADDGGGKKDGKKDGDKPKLNLDKPL